MRTAFVYATDNALSELEKQDILSVFHGTRMRQCTEHIVILDAGQDASGLQELHSQVFEYADALPTNKCADVYFLGEDLEFIQSIVNDLLAMGARVAIQTTPHQQALIHKIV